jgi:hypothetical protein
MTASHDRLTLAELMALPPEERPTISRAEVARLYPGYWLGAAVDRRGSLAPAPEKRRR